MANTLKYKPTCDVYDELGEEKTRIPDVEWKSYGATKQFAGYAVTVQCLEDNTWVKDMIESTIGDGKVLVVDGGGSKKCALLGDKIAATAVSHKWAGIVVYGCVRDVDALSKLKIGIQAIGHTPKKSTRKEKGKADIDVEFGGVSVKPGDLVYADSDGVVFVSPGDVWEA